MSQTPRVLRIHPAVGIARVGNSPSEFFIGPEQPGVSPNADPATGRFLPFKDPQARVKRQAARFRIFEYEGCQGRLHPTREITLGTRDVVDIRWTVHLANRKAAFFEFDGQDGASGKWSKLRNADIQGAERERRLVIDPGLRTISGRNQSPVRFDNPNRNIPIKCLGELRTDEAGRLLVLGGYGESGTIATPGSYRSRIMDYVNNDTWFDDMADGPVTATVLFTSGPMESAEVEVDPAWCLVGPPDFAPAAANIVRLSDLMWDLAVRKLPLSPDNGMFFRGRLAELKAQKEDWNEATKSFKSYKPSFKRDIYPLLERALLVRQVHDPESTKSFHVSFLGWEQELATVRSADGQELREAIFAKMRDPSGTKVDPKQMPKALGDDHLTDNPTKFMSLTHVQYALLRQWKDGRFREDWDGKPEAPPLAGDFTPEGLDFAALDNSVGGPFFPGIDVSWLIRHPNAYAEPFRIAHGARIFPDLMPVGPGFFSQQMALPWQADFYDCQKELYKAGDEGMYHMWWCTHRPDDVRVKRGDKQMQPWARKLNALAKQAPPGPEVVNPDGDHLTPEDLEHYAQMQKNWSALGFVIKEGEEYFEAEAGEPVQ
ncbi:LodA/GoxA family CTQ-dependent oxidase [Polyangium sp. 6x1]|uniref:LodA/GoxA family CTQ-dependent oxidase n=1 Tax=Polyangium sp. 6x1 TaxID=3042689 RepID=UPI0024827BF0|nr:LodA/GoxA family CTQ-dependent oxidase [Polyangium sp. 6x1]MDI1446418.1 LodA/GoxA family CTQ-dependent oxidase [Polyangium sp. 6x1]